MTDQMIVDNDGARKRVPLHGPEAFAAMRKAGRLAAETLDFITPHVRPGVSTGELDRLIAGFMHKHHATAATLGYRGYPKSCCISVNHVVNHGIPSDDKRLHDGDIANIDVTVVLDGWYGDSSRMFVVGDRVPVKALKLVEVTFEAMWAGIDAVRPGATLGDVGHAIQRIAEGNRFSVVRDFVGHGLGRVFHDSPEVKILADGWTTVTRDRSLSAQFEHTVGVTREGVEVFTLSPKGYERPPYPI